MEKNKQSFQPDSSPEEQLDQLLASFLTESDNPVPAETAAPTPEGDETADLSEALPDTPEEAEPAAESEIAPMEVPQEPEIGPDEAAVASAGLTHPDDLEFEKIIEEAMREEWGDQAVEDPVPQSEEIPATESDPEALDIGEDMQTAAVQEAAPQPEPPVVPEKKLPVRKRGKRRPKKKNTYGLFGIPHMITTVVWLTLIAFVGIGLGNMAWEIASDVLALGKPDQTVVITVDPEDDLDSLAEKLRNTGLIKYPGLFKLYGNITDAMDSIRSGTFQLSTQYDYHALVDQMSGNQSRLTTKVVIPEGYNCAQIFALLEKSGVCSAAQLEEAAANADLGDYWFLEGVERGSPYCLEGYLFPDTYQFYYGHDPEAVLQKMLNNFDKRFTDIMKGKLDILNENLSDMMRSHGLSEEYIANHQMTIREVVIIASMIEKETANNAESYHISSVIYNRLTNPGVYPFLNIDATLVYITGRSPVTDADKQLDSPYNTYLYKGLIPGPISNPSRASLDAALDPEMTEYHFYAFNPATGAHHFSKNYQEHLEFLASLNKGEE